MTALNKQALIAKIKKQTESFDTVVLKEDEANLLLDELEAAEKRIAELEAREVTLPQPAQWDISEVLLDKVKVVSAIRSAGIGVKGE
ncbi:hypothetical protein ACTJN4_15020 [Citrobacter freundii]|uniref:hypothetical protein n=1 Tax=Citrobacter freundii TaxID=546 RepID=UPI003F8AF505